MSDSQLPVQPSIYLMPEDALTWDHSPSTNMSQADMAQSSSPPAELASCEHDPRRRSSGL